MPCNESLVTVQPLSFLFETNIHSSGFRIYALYEVTIDGITYKVTSIAANAFRKNKKVTTVTIGKNVTAIGSKAFYNCSGLTALAIPSKVEKIGKHAFEGCSLLKTIRINTKRLTKKTVSEDASALLTPCKGLEIMQVETLSSVLASNLLSANDITLRY